MIDVDRFKEINDLHGHQAGDAALLAVSRIVEKRVRGKGKAYRYGGDEIAALLPNYTGDEGIALGEAIRKEIECTPFSEKPFQLTVSLGVAVLPDHAQESTGLLKCADDALYQAKRLGQNLIRLCGEPESSAARPREVNRRQPSVDAVSLEHLQDLVSELQDNLKTAQTFQIERTFLRPSSQCWKAVRNKVQLPEPVRDETANVYARIDQWAGIVDSGVNPLTGSMTIPAIAGEMRSSLPSLIDKLKKLLS